MASSLDKLSDVLQKSVLEAQDRKPKPYDTSAKVQRIEGNMAYVHIPGGVDETPVKLTSSADIGDEILVRVANGSAWGIGNSTNPPTDDRVAIRAQTTADSANKIAGEAFDSANAAKMAADYANEQAEIARDAADRAEIDAATANEAANEAKTDAATAKTAANEAKTDAATAKTAANEAVTAANTALVNLSVVEDVAGVLAWIQEHGSYVLATEHEVDPDKVYFIYNSTTNDYEPIISPDTTKDPSVEGWYILDVTDSQSEFIMAHLAVTQRGLWVLPSGMGTATDAQYAPKYKVLLSNDGMYLYDGSGNLVVQYGTNIEFGGSRTFHIGTNNAYILFDPTNGGSITIGGHNVNLGSNKTLEELLAEINGMFTFDTSYVIENRTINNEPHKIAVFTAHLYRNGVDIKETQTSGSDYIYPASRFTWYLKHENSQTQEGDYLGSGYTMEIDLNQCNFGAEVIAKYTTTEDSPLLDGDDNNLTTSDDTPITGRTESGESVRVRDLTVTTTLMPSDKLLIVGAEEEQIATIETVANTLWEMYGVTIENESLQQGNNNYEDIGLLSLTNIELEAMLA